jgi:hypothetical protein
MIRAAAGGMRVIKIRCDGKPGTDYGRFSQQARALLFIPQQPRNVCRVAI